MKQTITLFTLLFTTLSFAQSLQSGSYSGSNNRKEKMTLFVQDMREREGSFVALIVKENSKQAFSYLVEPYSVGRFGLIPLISKLDGTIGNLSQVPSLSLRVIGKEIKITQNSKRNQIGFTASMTFKKKMRKMRMFKEVQVGYYTTREGLDLDIEDNGDFYELASSRDGTLSLNPISSGLYMSLNYVYTSGSIIEENAISSYVVFIEENRKKKLLLIDRFGNFEKFERK